MTRSGPNRPISGFQRDPEVAGSGASTLFVGRGLAEIGGVDPTHRAIRVRDGVITWTGADPFEAPPADKTVDLGGAWLTPGFVDAHVHATATGLQANGLDLRGAGSVAEVLAAVREHAAADPSPVIFGAGWDDLRWPEGRPPTADELSSAAPGRTVLLVRVDGHSCVVDQALLETLDLTAVEAFAPRGDDGRPIGWLLEDASAIGQAAMRARLSADQVASARQATCSRAIELGITSIHEMGIPALSDQDDALAWATGDWPIEVIAYWADLDIDMGGPLRPGGDLFLDGSIGSCTAATSVAYPTNDGGHSSGTLFQADDVVADFFTRATRAGVGAGVHAIGDRAIGQAVRAIEAAADACGRDAVRATRHRIEHVELATLDHLAAMADLGVVASVQPAFDSVWNGPGGLYQHRFGRQAADVTNPFAWLDRAGVAMCFSSDSTVTPMDPWGGVLASENHRGGLSLARARSLHAATIGGHVAVRHDQVVGALTAGRRADFVAWPGDPLAGQTSAGWSPVAVIASGRQLL